MNWDARRDYMALKDFDIDEVRFAMTTDMANKVKIQIGYGTEMKSVALVTPAAMTHWPRCAGEGNFGTQFGPTDHTRAKYQIDLQDTPFEDGKEENEYFKQLGACLTGIDDKLLAFVHANQLKVLGRKSLSVDEVKMLMIRSVKPKYNKDTGTLNGHTVSMSKPVYGFESNGVRAKATVNVCDKNGDAIPNGVVQAGDVVSVTMFAKQAYTGVGNGQFGIHWSYNDVAVLCQRTQLDPPKQQDAFKRARVDEYDFVKDYVPPTSFSATPSVDVSDQFGD